MRVAIADKVYYIIITEVVGWLVNDISIICKPVSIGRGGDVCEREREGVHVYQRVRGPFLR